MTEQMADAPNPTLPPRYAPIRRLGRGGMAEVWLAEDRDAGGRVAIKLLFEHLRQDPLIAQRFKREIIAARRVQHAHVVALYDLIESDDALALVMEAMPGDDLKQLMRREGPLAPERAVRLIAQALDGLEAAHAAGVIHRDIKPQNILLSGEPGREVVKLADFGLARVDDMIGLTTHTTTLGTVEYMAPEQIGALVIDGRADLYAIGAVLYELLTGKQPFHAPTPMSLARMHREAPVPDPRALNPDLSPALAAIVRRALSKNPEDRPPTARAFAEALRQHDTTPRDEASHDARCPSCDALLVPRALTCLECGHDPTPRHERLARGKHAVVIMAPTRRGLMFSHARQRMLTTQQYETLKAFVHELAPAVQIRGVRALAGIRLQLLPVIVFDHLDEDDAGWVARELQRRGLPAQTLGPGLRARWQQLNQTLFSGATLFMFVISTFMLLIMGAVLGTMLKGVPGSDAMVPLIMLGMFMLASLSTSVLAVARLLPTLAPVKVTEAREVPLSQDVIETHDRLRSPHSRALLRRFLITHDRLAAQLDRAPTLQGMLLDELSRLERATLGVARRIAAIESSIYAQSPAQLYELIQAADAQIAREDDPHALDELVSARAERAMMLDALDAQHHELATLNQRLLELLDTLDDMARTAEALIDPDALTRHGEQASVALRTLREALDEEVVLGFEAQTPAHAQQQVAAPALAT